ncbi:MAG: WYL domain-containing protein, partial [Chloroflexota bacterium]|nr:WYL domain-containing protein [Chloroflexota bacterium]
MSSRQVALAYRRTLHIIQALQRAPRDRASLQSLVCRIEGEDAYHLAAGRALQKAFEDDLKRAREQFGVDIRYDRSEGHYRIVEVAERGWVDVPDEVLQMLVFLYHTFDEDAPQAEEVRAALDWLVSYLPTSRRSWIQQQRPGFEVELRELDQAIHPVVEERVRQAVRQRRELLFRYLSPRYPDQQPREHRVEPYELRLKEGHWYLRAY